MEDSDAIRDNRRAAPDNTAIRTALWRALHLRIDSPPHIIEDEVGLLLADPDEGWHDRPDMSDFTRPFRATILARARFIEDLVEERVAQGIRQYVILGAGLDTFAQRRPELAGRMRIYEIDSPAPQAWKRQRLSELGLGVPACLQLVPVNFEDGDQWWDELAAHGFDFEQPAIVASTGVSMYLTRQAIAATFRQVAALAPGSTLAERYFSGRTDGLRPPDNSEEFLIATT